MKPMLVLKPGNNMFHEAGQLDRQIASDFNEYAENLRSSGETGPRLEYASRIAALASAAMLENGQAPARIDADSFYAMHPAVRHAYVIKCAQDLIRAVGNYDMKTVAVERQSLHPDDWYLWSAAACHAKTGEWAAWTLNLSLGGLQGGHYNMRSTQDVNRVFAAKKGIQPDPQEEYENTD